MLAVVLAAPLMGSADALATTGHSFAAAFGAAGSGPGQFASGGPSGVAVDPSSGDVFVADPGHTLSDGTTPDPRIERFDASGAYLSSFSIDAAAFGSSPQLAVDPAGAGSVYVSTGAGSVLKYSLGGTLAYALNVGTSGTALAASGAVAVNPSDGSVYALAINAMSGAQGVDRFDGSTGAFVSSFDGFTCPSGLAVDGGSRVYVVDFACFGAGYVDRYSATGTYEATLDTSIGAVAAVAADRVTDEVLVGLYPYSGASPRVQGYVAGGGALGQSFDASQVGGFDGLAVNATSGAVYVADNLNTTVQRFAPFEGPTVMTTVASSVDAVSATLDGTIDPGGVSSTYHFEYGLDTTYGSQTAESDPVSGTGVVAATAPVSELLPNTTYHFRLVGSNASGSITADDQTFITDTAPPTLDASPVFASVTPTGAKLNGTVNPNSLPTSYHFEYGTDTSYGSSTTSADAGGGAGDQAVTAELTGLTAGTLYHFRLVADNGTGGEQHGADGVFFTAPGTPVSVTDVLVFGATLHGTINPHGAPATYHFEYGTTSAYGRNTAETDGGSGTTDLAVSQVTGRLKPNTTYHARVIATSNSHTTASDDATFTTGALPEAVMTHPTGVTTTQATIGGTVNTYGRDGSYRFRVDATNGAYATTTAAQPVPAGDGAHKVSAALSGLPAGESFRVVLSVTSNGGTTVSDQVVFSTAPVQVAAPPPPVSPEAAYGCGEPVLHAYNQHPKPGQTITIAGSDLGVGGTIALGETQVISTSWSASGFSVEIPATATGTLPLTINCGKASNTIAVAMYQAPDNRFTITKTMVTGATATLTLKLPGAGMVITTGARTAKKTTTISKAGTRTVKVALTEAGRKALNKTKSRKLKVAVRVSYTPSGGTPATLVKTVTFKIGSKR